MTQNDRDGLGMRKIKIISMKNVPHSNIIQVIQTSFWVEWHLSDDEFDIMIDVALSLEPLWENALGKKWKQLISRDKLRVLYEKM